MLGLVVLLLLSDWLRATIAHTFNIDSSGTVWVLTGIFVAGVAAIGYFVERQMHEPKG